MVNKALETLISEIRCNKCHLLDWLFKQVDVKLICGLVVDYIKVINPSNACLCPSDKSKVNIDGNCH